MRPKYSELNEEQIEALKKAGILNGCGPSWIEEIIPEADFKPCCFEHDFEWWIGGSNDRRIQSNKDFKTCMKERLKLAMSSGKYSGYRLWWFKIVSTFYYEMVKFWTSITRPFKKAYYYGPHRTWEDIDLIVSSYRKKD